MGLFVFLFTEGTVNVCGSKTPTFYISQNKDTQIIRYCLITSTAALVEIAVGLIPQYKVNKAKIWCADLATKDAQLIKSGSKEVVPKKIDAFKKYRFCEDELLEEYCRSL